MRSTILAAAPFVAAAYAQTTTSYGTTLVPELNSEGQTVTSTYTYSNPATLYLTQTNSDGVVTGLPANTATMNGMPAAVTSMPAVATIPAGLPTGEATLFLNVSSSLSSFTVSVGRSTTSVINGAASVTTGANPNASTGSGNGGNGGSGGSGGSGNGGSGNGGSGSSSASASSTSSGAAPGNVKVASAGVLGLGALFAALL